MIIYKKGNILTDEAPVLVNTVNLMGVMGKGVALAFKEAFPKNFAEYVKACKRPSFTIGRLCIVEDYNILYGHKTIINLPTKMHWRDNSEYRYIIEGLDALRNYIIYTQPAAVAVPALGCGNGGLDWTHVRRTMVMYLHLLETPIHVYEPNMQVVWSK